MFPDKTPRAAKNHRSPRHVSTLSPQERTWRLGVWQDGGKRDARLLPSRGPIPPTEKMLAGQPQEPWQSSEQDQAPPGWQSYSPPAAENPDTYAYRQSGAAAQGYGQQGGYGQQAGYAAPPY